MMFGSQNDAFEPASLSGADPLACIKVFRLELARILFSRAHVVVTGIKSLDAEMSKHQQFFALLGHLLF